MNRDRLLNFINNELASKSFEDDSHNGLQVEGKKDIKSVLLSVSASLQLIKKAVDLKVDAIIVHHGLLWGKQQRITGVYAEKIRLLLENGINFFAWHLPLDAHRKLGNNINIIKLFPVSKIEPFGQYKKSKIGFKAKLKKSIPCEKIFTVIKEKINPKALILPFGADRIKKIAVISGGGQGMFSQAVTEKVDLYITGEASEQCYEIAREEKIHFVAAGHYASEKFAIKALEKIIARKFKLKTFFYDSKNPI